jgi:hypothetical protein
MKAYARLVPPDLPAGDREAVSALLDRLDEDEMERLYAALPAQAGRRKVLEILKEARAIGDRLNMMDRTIPALPHSEITQSYARLRELGNQLDELEASEASSRSTP